MTHSTKILRNKQADFATKPILWAYFERKYLSREDGFKYEWLNGTIEKHLAQCTKHNALYSIF